MAKALKDLQKKIKNDLGFLNNGVDPGGDVAVDMDLGRWSDHPYGEFLGLGLTLLPQLVIYRVWYCVVTT